MHAIATLCILPWLLTPIKVTRLIVRGFVVQTRALHKCEGDVNANAARALLTLQSFKQQRKRKVVAAASEVKIADAVAGASASAESAPRAKRTKKVVITDLSAAALAEGNARLVEMVCA